MDLPFIANLSNVDLIILIGAGIVFLVMAYMIFKQIMKAIIIGAISASIPVVLYLLGFDIGISLQTVIWFGLAGIATYFVYDVISGWMTIMRIITWPIRRLFGRGKKLKKEGAKAPSGEKSEEKAKDFKPKEEKTGKETKKEEKENKDKKD